jgi:hypothetical protein|tara:strand:- start:48 stop:230 length:183 start_codon:yes stop_codon:yes gene_type:complete
MEDVAKAGNWGHGDTALAPLYSVGFSNKMGGHQYDLRNIRASRAYIIRGTPSPRRFGLID